MGHIFGYKILTNSLEELENLKQCCYFIEIDDEKRTFYYKGLKEI